MEESCCHLNPGIKFGSANSETIRYDMPPDMTEYEVHSISHEVFLPETYNLHNEVYFKRNTDNQKVK